MLGRYVRIVVFLCSLFIFVEIFVNEFGCVLDEFSVFEYVIGEVIII